jgi:hypothetical protein
VPIVPTKIPPKWGIVSSLRTILCELLSAKRSIGLNTFAQTGDPRAYGACRRLFATGYAPRGKARPNTGRSQTAWRATEFTASKIPGAKLVVYDLGGHLLVERERELRATIRDFLTASGVTSQTSGSSQWC